MTARAEPRGGRHWWHARLRRGESGQSAFEFVLVLPIFIIFMLLIVDLGILMYEYVSVSNAVREGARYASVNCPSQDPVTHVVDPSGCKQVRVFCPGETTGGAVFEVRQRVIERSGGILGCTDDIKASWVNTATPANNYDRGDTVVVRVSHDYAFLFVPYTIPVVSCASMQLEQADGGGSATPSSIPLEHSAGWVASC